MRRTNAFILTLALISAGANARADIGMVTQYGALGTGTKKGVDRLHLKQVDSMTYRDLMRKKRRSIFRIISWNVQTFGNLKPERAAAFDMLSEMFSKNRSSKVLALQEVANDTGLGRFSDLLPGGKDRWNDTFQNTNDSQDNGFFTQKSVTVDCEEFLFAREDTDGRWRRRPDRQMHPARAAHMRVGDFDFTLITLHLTFAKGDTKKSGEELRNILRWLEDYLDNPENDPDVILAGDFNMSTRKGKGSSRSKKPVLEDIIKDFPTFARMYDSEGKHVPRATELISLVDAPTSRYKGTPKNNYDHFIMTGDTFYEEFVKGSAGPIPSDFIEAAEKEHDIYVSDHLPISAGFQSKGIGNDGEPIRTDQIGPTSSRSCWKRGRK
jgi:exonuclease III